MGRGRETNGKVRIRLGFTGAGRRNECQVQWKILVKEIVKK